MDHVAGGGLGLLIRRLLRRLLVGPPTIPRRQDLLCLLSRPFIFAEGKELQRMLLLAILRHPLIMLDFALSVFAAARRFRLLLIPLSFF